MKKIISILLTVCMTALSAVMVSAENTAIISMGNVKAESGQEITIPLSVENNTKGVATIFMDISYDDSYLEYVSFEKGIYQSETIVNGNEPGILALGTMSVSNCTGDGVLFNFKFKVKDTAEKNINIPITLDVKEFHYLDNSYDQILAEHIVNNGSVIINEENKPVTTVTTTEATTKSEPTTQPTTKAQTTQVTTKAEPTTQAATQAPEPTTKAPAAQTTTKAPVVTTEAQSESTTVAVAETGTETTTIRTSSGSLSGGGGGIYKPKTTTATTETTTEVTTQIAEKLSEKTTEAAKEDNAVDKEVRVSIGSNIISVGDAEFIVDAVPYIQPESSSTLIPLRFVAIAISGEDVGNADTSSIVGWDANSKTASVKAKKHTVLYTAGSNVMTVDGKAVTMDNGAKAEIKDGRMYIPFRALGNALGVKVDWNADTKTAIFSV